MKTKYTQFTKLILISLFFVTYAHHVQAQVNFIGSATLEAGNPSNCIQITPASTNQIGWVYSMERFNLNQNQNMVFDIYVGTAGNAADGVVFVLHNDPRGFNAAGCRGQALGYGGQAGFQVNCDLPNGGTGQAITPSIGVEFDIFRNSDWNEPICDHVAFLSNGNANHVGAGADLTNIANGYVFGGASPIPCAINNGRLHELEIDWKAAPINLLTVFFTFNSNGTEAGKVRVKVLERNIPNLITQLGTAEPFWGFTGSTGGFATQQYFCMDEGITLNNPLPIRLLSFEGSQVGQRVRLDWTTVQEENNSHFTVERSDDAIHFTPIGTKAGAGNSIELLSYTLYDESPLQGINYYRLKQTDFDGTFTYSYVIAVNFQPLDVASRIYPNPTKNGKLIFYQGIYEPRAVVEVWDIQGKKIATTTLKKSTEQSVSSFEIPFLDSGVYLIKIQKNNTSETYRLMVQD